MSGLQGHLDAIGERLWTRGGTPGSGRCSIMVGAGFSRNAKRRSALAPPFPDWADVARSFVDRLYPRCASCCCDDLRVEGPPECRAWRARRRNLLGARETSGALRLAEMYQAVHGRAALEGVLREAVPTSHYDPGILHQQLVRLPWADIFTTNWDTLLEGAIDLYDRSYSIVNSASQIPVSERPRIVKLHGTIDAGTRLIFSESDFLKYPSEYAPFVSLVRQSMIENMFVLVGFSGEDPNFLQWMHWVRYQLNDYVKQVYLIGFDDPDEAERRLLADRGVIPLNIMPLLDAGDGASKEKALQSFFSKLESEKRRVRANQRWPRPGPDERTDSASTARRPDESWVAGASAMVREWRRRLREAPMWLLLPHENREDLMQRFGTRGEFADIAAVAGNDLRYLGDWSQLRSSAEAETKPVDPPGLAIRAEAVLALLEVCDLSRCLPNLVQCKAIICFLRDLAALDGPDVFGGVNTSADVWAAFDDVLSVAADTLFDAARSQGAPVLEAAVRTVMLVMRAARLRRADDAFRRCRTMLEALKPNPLGRLDLDYELALHALGGSNLQRASSATDSLRPDFGEPRWGLRKAALLTELGRRDEARALLDETVERMRQLVFQPGHTRGSIWQASREAWAQLVYKDLLIQDEVELERHPNPDELRVKEKIEELDQRLDEVPVRSCDPRPEIVVAESNLNESVHEWRRLLGLTDGTAMKPSADRLPSTDSAIAFILTMEAVGLTVRLIRHRRLGAPGPLAVTAAVSLLSSHPALGRSLLARAAMPADLDLCPIPLVEMLRFLGEDDAKAFHDDIRDRFETLVSGAEGTANGVPVTTVDERAATLVALLAKLAAAHPDLAAGHLGTACDWHDRPGIQRLRGTRSQLSRLFRRVLTGRAIDWATVLPRLLALHYPMRPGECWGRPGWPDPFGVLVERARVAGAASASDAGFVLTAAGTEAVAGSGTLGDVDGHIASLQQALAILPQAETASIRRRLAFLDAVRRGPAEAAGQPTGDGNGAAAGGEKRSGGRKPP